MPILVQTTCEWYLDLEKSAQAEWKRFSFNTHTYTYDTHPHPYPHPHHPQHTFAMYILFSLKHFSTGFFLNPSRGSQRVVPFNLHVQNIHGSQQIRQHRPRRHPQVHKRKSCWKAQLCSVYKLLSCHRCRSFAYGRQSKRTASLWSDYSKQVRCHAVRIRLKIGKSVACI